MDNYEFCTEWAVENGRQPKVLDYGCGAAHIVQRLHARGIDAYGCDVFYEGGDYSSLVPVELSDRVKRMVDGKIPFPDAAFDLVINNQVMEHVPDLAAVLKEIDRVLKPGGKVLSMFPDRSVWREGHCGVPFLHWFPKHSQPRVYYAWVLRSLGAGYHKQDKSRWQWSVDFCNWLDAWTHYRPLTEIQHEYERHFQLKFLEPKWLDRRAPRVSAVLPTAAKRLLVRKLGMLVIEGQKP